MEASKKAALVRGAKKWGMGLATVAMVAGPGLAMAQDADTSAATAAFAEVGTAVTAIGKAMLVAAGAGIVYKWVTAFLI